MAKPQFPDLTYLATKMYEGINRQDFAELSAIYCSDIREQLQNYKPQITNSVDKIGYDSTLESVMRHLTELEMYFKRFNENQRRISRKAAGQFHAQVLKQLDALKQLSQR
jgi:molecular chaperone GrpE (heat shock protein)